MNGKKHAKVRIILNIHMELNFPLINAAVYALEKGPAPAGMYEECVSDYGVYDMSGNVWEWTDKPGAIYYGGFWDSGPEIQNVQANST